MTERVATVEKALTSGVRYDPQLVGRVLAAAGEATVLGTEIE